MRSSLSTMWMTLGLGLLVGCTQPEPNVSGRQAQQALEQAIDRFCLCGQWPEDACPAYRANETELSCLDGLYQAQPDVLAPYAECVYVALDDLSVCLLESGDDCGTCRDRWALTITDCRSMIDTSEQDAIMQCISGM